MKIDRMGLLTVLLLTALLWGMNILWLLHDTRPPVWDMALHQTYAFNYLDDGNAPPEDALKPWGRSGIYPPFVHLCMAALFLIFHPGPHIAALVNLPATFLLLWAVYELAKDHAGIGAARWACILTVLIPYLTWVSRETILDYWLSAWFAVSIVALRKTRGFQSRSWSLLFGCILAMGLLTKWFLAGFVLVPIIYVFVESRIWKHRERSLHFADALIISGVIAGLWYFPNIPRLVQHFGENMAIGAREGEPPVFSFQSFIYYLRLLEGYQLFGLLFVILCLACIFLWRKERISDWRFLLVTIAGGWLIMTLLRTKDPRFTMPLLGLLAVISGAWVHSWGETIFGRLVQVLVVALLMFQVYAANFGVTWLPNRLVILEGYQGSLRWDWNLYLQDYFGVFGAPKRENWKLAEILQRVVSDAKTRNAQPRLALVPDLPRFNESNFALYARILNVPVQTHHLKSVPQGISTFDGYDYAVMTEHEQGMSWTTGNSLAMNQIIVDHPEVFRLIEVYTLPTGDGARLYFIQSPVASGFSVVITSTFSDHTVYL
jgi:4-amino-4-deoxy-L-arabinose transferase-like glycosyltransferase